MPNPGKQTALNFFAAAQANRLGMIPSATALAAYGNLLNGNDAASSYNSRVLSTQINGAGPDVPPLNAPFSFSDFATGKKFLTMKGTTSTVTGGIIRSRFG